jgi:hypothetical protein
VQERIPALRIKRTNIFLNSDLISTSINLSVIDSILFGFIRPSAEKMVCIEFIAFLIDELMVSIIDKEIFSNYLFALHSIRIEVTAGN